jgi:pimeloyl-ACP methyl ester carboxylesterase
MMDISIDGSLCRVATSGPADGPPLLLVHGAANDCNAWRDVTPPLAAAGLRVLAPDLPGHGASHGSPLTSVESLATWMLRLADMLGLQRFALAGHSMGSLVALEAASLAPDRISHLSLLGAALPMPVSPQLLEMAGDQSDAACRMVTLWSHTPGFLLSGSGGHGIWGAGKTLAVMRRNRHTLANDLDNCNRYEGGLAAAAGVSCPSLLVLGRRDRMTPLRSVQALASALPLPQRYEIADCGHAMMVEKPREVASAILASIAPSLGL